MAPITLRRGCLVSQGAYLCAGTHDYNSPDFTLVVRPIDIGEKAWICARAIVGPGVKVGAYAVLGAGSVTFSDLQPGVVYAGNPAKPIKQRSIPEPSRRENEAQ
jgi:putative colanic acid biosynthesis acetyltransferase WcaF